MSIFRASKGEAIYFDLFIDLSVKANEAATLMQDLIDNFTDVDVKVERISGKEHDCDILVHDIMRKLNSSFVTPLDREDIDHIAHVMDNVVDGIEAAAMCFTMYSMTTIKDEAKAMCALISRCTASLTELMQELKRMKTSKSMHKIIIEINSFENEGDTLYRSALNNLFLKETNPVDIIKWKDMYELLENTIDACEDVANIVEGVVMKHA